MQKLPIDKVFNILELA